MLDLAAKTVKVISREDPQPVIWRIDAPCDRIEIQGQEIRLELTPGHARQIARWILDHVTDPSATPGQAN